jgi:CheY-like chemotaxis protein
MKDESPDKEMGATRRPVVLYVDDVATNLMLFKAAFERDYEILLAESGAIALEMLEEMFVNVLVADYKMPGITGNELLSIVAGKYPDVMRFMITAYTDYATLVEAINKGQLYGFFNKPYKIDEVRQAINRSLEVQELKGRNRQMIRELEKANEVMLGLDRAKTRFIAAITDEIRNPINKIVTAVHMIKDKVDSREFTELLYLLDTSVRNLESFSEAASHFIRLNEKGCLVENQPVSLSEVIEVGILEKGNLLQQQDIHVQLNTAEPDLVITGEFALVLAAFGSLLGFLVNHAPRSAEVVLSLQSDNTGKTIVFSAEGVVLSENELQELRQVTSGKVAYDNVFRLELALVSEIMKVHDGKFVMHEAGSTFVFSLVFKP